jgi:hypothetical protein
MPKTSEEYHYYKVLCGNYEAFAHRHYGGFTNLETVNIVHFKKARAIYNLVDMRDDAKKMDTLISMLIAKQQASNDTKQRDLLVSLSESALEVIEKKYKQKVISNGMNSDETIASGLNYAQVLWGVNRRLEAERIAAKLATASRQVNGPEHRITILADELLKKCRVRYIFVLPDCKQFQALRYENGGEICVVVGPITKPRQPDDERIYRVESHLVYPKIGCAVICHGLVSASHLNGELGEVREMKRDGTDTRRAVYFEKKGAKSALVKAENLRIAFELPNEAV